MATQPNRRFGAGGLIAAGNFVSLALRQHIAQRQQLGPVVGRAWPKAGVRGYRFAVPDAGRHSGRRRRKPVYPSSSSGKTPGSRATRASQRQLGSADQTSAKAAAPCTSVPSARRT